MSGTVNRVILVGHLGRDPEISDTKNGRVAKFSVATKETWRDRESGERKESTEWHNVVVFNKALVDLAERSLKKGLKVYVCGKQKTRSWDDKDTGKKRYATETVLGSFDGDIQILTPRGEGSHASDEHSSYGSAGRESGGEPRRRHVPFRNDPDEDIPF